MKVFADWKNYDLNILGEFEAREDTRAAPSDWLRWGGWKYFTKVRPTKS